MYWLLKGNDDNDTCIFYQVYNKSSVIEHDNFSCYKAQSDEFIQKGNERTVIYDIYIKGNIIKYVNKEEEKTFIYETNKISSDSSVLIFKNVYKKTDNSKLPCLLDMFYDNIYRNTSFIICELPNNTLQIKNGSINNNFVLTTIPPS